MGGWVCHGSFCRSIINLPHASCYFLQRIPLNSKTHIHNVGLDLAQEGSNIFSFPVPRAVVLPYIYMCHLRLSGHHSILVDVLFYILTLTATHDVVIPDTAAFSPWMFIRSVSHDWLSLLAHLPGNIPNSRQTTRANHWVISCLEMETVQMGQK